jgi:hypothetical protein
MSRLVKAEGVFIHILMFSTACAHSGVISKPGKLDLATLASCKAVQTCSCPEANLPIGQLSVLQVGACIVSQDQIILGIGYNGFPRGCPDSELPWAKLSRKNDPLDTKYPYVCHAELNAILNKNTASLQGAVSATLKAQRNAAELHVIAQHCACQRLSMY